MFLSRLMHKFSFNSFVAVLRPQRPHTLTCSQTGDLKKSSIPIEN